MTGDSLRANLATLPPDEVVESAGYYLRRFVAGAALDEYHRRLALLLGDGAAGDRHRRLHLAFRREAVAHQDFLLIHLAALYRVAPIHARMIERALRRRARIAHRRKRDLIRRRHQHWTIPVAIAPANPEAN